MCVVHVLLIASFRVHCWSICSQHEPTAMHDVDVSIVSSLNLTLNSGVSSRPMHWLVYRVLVNSRSVDRFLFCLVAEPGCRLLVADYGRSNDQKHIVFEPLWGPKYINDAPAEVPCTFFPSYLPQCRSDWEKLQKTQLCNNAPFAVTGLVGRKPIPHRVNREPSNDVTLSPLINY